MRSFLPALLAVTLVLASSYCMAGDNKTIMISCTIPEIPGVNAPFLVEEKVEAIPETNQENANGSDFLEAGLLEQAVQYQNVILYTYVTK
jgi:hypothetical protein